MKTPERLTALKVAKQTLRIRDQRIARMKKKLDLLTSQKGVAVDIEVQKEIEETISNKKSEIEALPTSDFRRVFWEQQVRLVQVSFGAAILWTGARVYYFSRFLGN